MSGLLLLLFLFEQQLIKYVYIGICICMYVI